ncbi:LysR family transcriptional regulator [Flammeovirga yaeyamensis]|uniref:LysR family transcriptional regulator n=1 Tax=Flammeovirga yaeyamensis TaxID=367791 RepID=A0AAX1NA84_9BACT|nr:LysR family transcriptional regulator [Flammeovirga yaeyamensis]MBB3699476.1 DNA-binding transcriptional LysR family regulator [Flammeovirga yaeyamensis]NMF35267.1 LysR family transcriptional regulator [Flammeovirga yaeyamensis]QWG04127.1 LysR family transcriptional regulator [Flammeovirga yaeyamensis]
MVNLEWYRTFKEVYENGTLTKAANALYSSQPGVSVHLNALEAYIGKKLFERTTRKMIPTEEGKFLYEYIINSILKLEKAEQHFRRSSKERKPSVHIGMCSEMFQLVLENKVPDLEFDLIAKFGSHIDLIKDLSNGLLDLVITPKTPDTKKALVTYTSFAKERIVLVAGNNVDTTEIDRLIEEGNWKELDGVLQSKTWYSASNEMEHFRRFWFENLGKKPVFKPNYILPNISSIIRCLYQAEGMALVPDFLCKKDIVEGKIKLVWEGKVATENTLHFATRSDLKYKKELNYIEDIFIHKFEEIRHM